MTTSSKKTATTKKPSGEPVAKTSMAEALSEVTDLLPNIKKSGSKSSKAKVADAPTTSPSEVSGPESVATAAGFVPTETPVLATTTPDPVVASLLAEDRSTPVSPPVEHSLPQEDLTIHGEPPSQSLDSGDLTETQSSTLNPAFFDLEDAPASTTGTLMRIKLYGPGCLECSKLVDGAESVGSATPECHVTRGNEYCPAREVHIEFVGERVNFLRRIRKAQDSGNASRVLRLLSELDNKPSSFKKAVLQELNLLRSN